MKSPYVSELEFDKAITAGFQVLAKQVREKKTGEPYLALVLGDRTGRVDAKMWDNVAEIKDTFEVNDFVKVRAQLQSYNNRRQLIVQRLRRLEAADYDPADYLPASLRNPDEMFAELSAIVAGIRNSHLRALLETIFADQEIAARFRRAPAAKQIHHAFLGGLLEHVLSLCGLCRLAATHYPAVDGDLLLAGAILHDIGKIHELGYEAGLGYTSDGQLLGHIVMGVRLIEEKLRGLPDFPPRLRTLLEHMVLSHHGHLEFGSPKVPLFAEALLLHYLDDMDSKMECMRALVEQDLNGDAYWTSYSNAMERIVLRKQAYLAETGEAKPESSRPAEATPRPENPSGLLGERLRDALREEK